VPTVLPFARKLRVYFSGIVIFKKLILADASVGSSVAVYASVLVPLIASEGFMVVVIA
jgi:hypothetical protein